MPKKHIYLVRHGQYQLSKRDQGELTERGQEQALSVAYAMRNIPFSTVISSPVTRAAQTADIIAELLPNAERIIDERLRECIPHVPEAYVEFFGQHYPDITSEKMQICAETVGNAIQSYFTASVERDEYVMIVCHGNVIRFIVSQVLDSGSTFWIKMLINNCGISRITIDSDGQIFLQSHNDIGHMPHHLLTEN